MKKTASYIDPRFEAIPVRVDRMEIEELKRKELARIVMEKYRKMIKGWREHLRSLFG